MPTPTYTALANITLGSATGSVTFSSIPATYRDLVLVLTATTSSSASHRFQINSDSGSNYLFVRMSGNGSSATSGGSAQTHVILSSVPLSSSSARIQSTTQIMDYSATDKHKTMLTRTDEAGSGTEALANRWANTAAVTSIFLYPNTGTWSVGSTFALYGIAS